MKKIPNINTHIFKQPNLPWQVEEAGFSPSDLESADRPMLAWWDSSLPLTEVTGVSNEPDQGVNGLDIAQGTGAAQPILSGSGASSVITYDGSDDFLSRAVTSGDWQDLTYHEYWAAVNVDQASFKNIFMCNDDGSSKNDRYVLNVTASGVAQIQINDNSSTNNGIKTSSAVSVGWHIIGFISDGTNHSMIIDNSLATITVIVSNDGQFVGGLTNKANIDVLSIGSQRLASPGYSANLEKFGLSLGGSSTDAATSTAERTEIFNYINTRFQLGL